MKFLKWAIIGFGAFELYSLVRFHFGNLSDKIRMGTSKVTVQSVEPDETQLLIEQEIQNGSDVDLPAASFSGWLMFGELRVAPIRFREEIALRAGQKKTVDIIALVDHIETPANIITAISTGNFTQRKLRIVGHFRKSGYKIPFEKVIDV